MFSDLNSDNQYCAFLLFINCDTVDDTVTNLRILVHIFYLS